ncbi:GATOR complex protein WDR59-like [Homarus americanus]|uniref:GATOR complex protein WDR59-like n=1 Tax=Homarus americanus TaxID=6706 RepID=A0A8J5N8V4_HOMAM|nr:GATOR complex protein WDR59-like [Homarus americanus]
MAVRWSSENVVAEHRDLQANSMALDWRGEYTLLAGRRNLALISLDNPTEVVKRVSRTQQKYDVTAAEWNPTQSHGHTFSGERAEICQWTEGSLNGTTTLRAHTRTITDLNWHRSDPNLLSTCSIDTFVYIWDTRETRKPISCLSAIAGASQVKWNKLNQNLLASGHDCDIRVWDNRKTSQPVQYIAAHLSKIQGLDWSPNHENHLVTSSNDCTVKFFDITNPRKAENFINTLSPVWRARYTPFGEGVVTVVVPQLRRGENSLLLWSVTDMSSPVHTFVGHSDVVLEFEWRQNTNNPGEHQLVTWALCFVDFQLCGHDTEEEMAFAESTDSEFAHEPAPTQSESECYMEKGTEKDLEKDDEQDVAEVKKDIKQRCKQASTESIEKVSHENSPEIGSANEAPQISPNELNSVTNNHSVGDSALINASSGSQPLTNFPSVMPTTSKVNNVVVGMSSTLPSGNLSSGQPMSLQQEFSLLNTSLDNSQVNSVEVVAGEMKILADEGSRTRNQEVSNIEGERRSLENQLKNIAYEETRLDDENRSDLANEVENLARDIGDNGNLDECHFSLMDSKTRVLDVYHKSNICHIKAETTFNQEINDFEQNTTCDMTREKLSSEVTSGEMLSVAVNYFPELENSNKDFLSKIKFDNGGMCVIKVKSSNDDQPYNFPRKEKIDIKQEESPFRITVRSEGNHLFSLQSETQENNSFMFPSDEIDSCLLKDTKEEHNSSDSPGISVISLAHEAPSYVEGMNEIGAHVDITKEEAVIHVVDSENMSSDGENPACFTIAEPIVTTETNIPVGETMLASNENQIQLLPKHEMPDSASLTPSLPFIGAQNALNAVIMDGSLMIRSSDDTPIQVPAKLIYLPATEDGGSEFSEEMCVTFAPQLFEGGVLVPGDNIIILGNHSFLTSVELVLVDGETQTQISISPVPEPLESYQDKGGNFVMITRSLEQTIALSSNSTQEFLKIDLDALPDRKFPVQNAPHSDEPGLFQCDKCDKTYKVRSSLNSHKVTHNTEKMYKCDECGKAFHYSTPLQIHKRTHSDERPYRCQSCAASFRSKANLRYHERLHTGERPITCRECGKGFKDYTSLKRHRQKAHDVMNMKCHECGLMCNSVENLASHLGQAHNKFSVDKILFCERCEETLTNQKSYGIHMANHERIEKISQGTPGKLSDYTHKCGICNMVCQSKPQMLVHIQIHAAVKRFQCRYCKKAYMYRFILAHHVREEHPHDPQWFCQHCDVTFETCRQMNTHSCRTVRGNYSCPHCDFKTEIRHRLFRHIIKEHPADKTPYYCDFCKSSYEDPSKLRYHQKREHPEKMLMLTMHREATRHVPASGDKTDSLNIDMSQVEMTVEGNVIIYYIPKHLRNDEVFREKVKFKCFYCEAKFPVKNSMTRHILREHPGEKAYKCLQCNIFLKSNVESKNHNRKYHKYSNTGGRDPLRNEKAMKKKAQMFEKQLQNAGTHLKNIYKFRCRYCSMPYRCKRPLIVHYKKWHPDEEWDHFPDQPSRNTSVPSKRKRKLLFFDCNFDDQCQSVFDDMAMLLEHLSNAHSVKNEDAKQYINKRIVVEAVRRGRLPKNAIEVVTNSNNKYRRIRKKVNIKSETDDEDDLDDPGVCDEKLDSDDDLVKEIKTIDDTPSPSLNDGQKVSPHLLLKSAERKKKSLPATTKKSIEMNLNNIGSVRDVKKMLYRCRRCGISFCSKRQYREHNSLFSDVDCCDFEITNVKKEPESEGEGTDEYDTDENYQLSSGPEDDESDEGNTPKRNRKPKKSELTPTSNLNFFVKKELEHVSDNVTEDIVVTSLDEDNSEDILKVLTISASELGQPGVHVKVEMITPKFSDLNTQLGITKERELTKLHSNTKSLLMSSGKIEKSEVTGKFSKGKRCKSFNKTKSCDQLPEMELHLDKEVSKALQIRSRPSRSSVVTGSRATQCEQCQMTFKTRAELSFHKRLDH